MVSRREAIRRAALGVLALGAGAPGAGCSLGTSGPSAARSDGRLTARPGAPTGSAAPGLTRLDLAAGRDGLLYVPASYRPAEPAPIALLLHGAGRASNEMTDPMRSLADDAGLVLLAPDSRGSTWDASLGGYGPDVAFLDAALAHVFARVNVDPARVRIAGFSDGASYALSIGRINGDLFGRIAAFSPGFVADGAPTGKPKILITHGTRDTILPIDSTSRRIVPSLRAAGYDVDYREFDGGHGITPELLREATGWLAQ